MSASAPDLRLVETGRTPAEDDLSAMRGLFNGLIITSAFYVGALAMWWMC